MSNKTQLQTNNTNLDALITRVNAAKDTAASLPSAGSGGGVQTCTIMINSFAANLTFAKYTSYENGVYTYHDENFIATSDVASATLENVVCGGIVEIYSHYPYCWFEPDAGTYDFLANFGNYCIIVPTANMTVTVVDDD